LTWLAAFGFMLTAPCLTAWFLVSEDYKVVPVLVWCIGVVFLAASFIAPAPAQHEPVGAGGFLPAPAPTRLQCSDVDWTDAVRSLTLTGEDDAAVRTVLSNEDDPS
jgi:hypothetical protein